MKGISEVLESPRSHLFPEFHKLNGRGHDAPAGLLPRLFHRCENWNPGRSMWNRVPGKRMQLGPARVHPSRCSNHAPHGWPPGSQDPLADLPRVPSVVDCFPKVELQSSGSGSHVTGPC